MTISGGIRPEERSAVVEGVSSNGFIAAVFGRAKMVRPGRASSTFQPPPDTINPANDRPAYARPVDTVELTAAAASNRGERDSLLAQKGLAQPTPAVSPARATDGGKPRGDPTTDTDRLTEQERAQVDELKKRDQEVRRHEQAHVAAAGAYARATPRFEFQTGPDGKRYAVEGEVQIDTSEVPNDPKATISKMQQIRRAALAPGEPSSQDHSIAAQAAATEQQARAELAEQQRAGPVDTGDTQRIRSSADAPPGSQLDRGRPESDSLPSASFTASISTHQTAVGSPRGARLDLNA